MANTTHQHLADRPDARTAAILREAEARGSMASEAGWLRGVVRSLVNELADYANDHGYTVILRGVECAAHVDDEGSLVGIQLCGVEILDVLDLGLQSEALEQIARQNREAMQEHAAEDDYYRRAA